MERTCTSGQGRITPPASAWRRSRSEDDSAALNPASRTGGTHSGPQRGRWWIGLAGPGLGGLLMFSGSLLGLPLSTTHLAQFEALNRELGKLCSKPPPQAFNVCRLHARLVNGL